jgi:hypothetical protein
LRGQTSPPQALAQFARFQPVDIGNALRQAKFSNEFFLQINGITP